MQENEGSKEILQELMAKKGITGMRVSLSPTFKQVLILYLRLISFCAFAMGKNAGIVAVILKFGLPVLQFQGAKETFKETTFFDHLNIVALF